MNTSSRRFVVGAAAVAASALPAAASVVYSTQARSVTAFAEGVSQTFAATDFSNFNMTASAAGPQAGTATASQNSTLGTSIITAIGSAQATGLNANPDNSTSSFDVTFTVTADSPFLLSGQTTAFPDPDAFVRLSHAGTNMFLSTSPSTISFPGNFVAGESYRLEVNCVGRNFTGGPDQSASFNLTLSVPAPGTLGLAAAALLIPTRRRRR
jgi:hypothetical protein